jgi:TPR repeat protein/serine/threonine protein kinase
MSDDDSDDSDDIVDTFRRAADVGNVRAMNNLGWCYYNGRGVVQDFDEAVIWYRRAADAGDETAMNDLGRCYYNGRGVVQDFDEAVIWYRRAADTGNAAAMYNLGRCYYNGRGVAQDFDEAARWYRRAADAGNAAAMFNLGINFLLGKSGRQDIIAGIQFHQQAAEAGYSDAMSNLAYFHLAGFGVEQNADKAKDLCHQALAADSSNEHAAFVLAELLGSSLNIFDFSEAIKLVEGIPDESGKKMYGRWISSFLTEQKIRIACHPYLHGMALPLDFVEDASIQPVALIGQGHFGKVYLCWQQDRWVAVKNLSVDLIQTEEVAAMNLMRERLVCRMIRAHNVEFVVHYIGMVYDLTHYYRGLVFALHADFDPFLLRQAETIRDRRFVSAQNADWNSLADFTSGDVPLITNLRHAVVFPRGKRPAIDTIVRIFRDVAKAIQFLHSIGIIHRDIADRNVLCDGAPDYNVKLADFGLSKFVGVPEADELLTLYEKRAHQSQQFYPVAFMAPETIGRGDDGAIIVYSAESDVWSFGMLMYQCLAGSDPFDDMCKQNTSYIRIHSDIAKAILEGHRPDLKNIRNDTPDAIIGLMADCWSTDPEQRPLLRNVIQSLDGVLDLLNKTDRRVRSKLSSPVEAHARWKTNPNRLYSRWSDVTAESAESATVTMDLTDNDAAITFAAERFRQIGYNQSPSLSLDERILRKLGIDWNPFDVFLIHTGAEKSTYASTTKYIFESCGLQCFLDRDCIRNGNGPPPRQMTLSLETCRYAVVFISKAFLERKDPCDELVYASSRMQWLRDNCYWESLWIVLLDISLEEYNDVRREKRPSLPAIGKQNRLYLFNSVYMDPPNLAHILKKDLVDHDKEKNTIDKWRHFLDDWQQHKDFPRGDRLYAGADVESSVEMIR